MLSILACFLVEGVSVVVLKPSFVASVLTPFANTVVDVACGVVDTAFVTLVTSAPATLVVGGSSVVVL